MLAELPSFMRKENENTKKDPYLEWKSPHCTVSNEWDTIYYPASKIIPQRMLRVEYAFLGGSSGCVCSQKGLECH